MELSQRKVLIDQVSHPVSFDPRTNLQANMKEKPVEEDTLKEDIEGIVAGLEHVEEGDRDAIQ